MVLSKDRVEPVKIKRTQIDVCQKPKLKVYLRQNVPKLHVRKKLRGAKGKTVVANTKKARVSVSRGGEMLKTNQKLILTKTVIYLHTK